MTSITCPHCGGTIHQLGPLEEKVLATLKRCKSPLSTAEVQGRMSSHGKGAVPRDLNSLVD